MYDVYFTKTAKSQLRKLEKKTQKRITSVIERARIRPEAFVRRLVGEPYYKLRAGDYRIILDIQKGRMIIMILYIDHRGRIYNRYKQNK